MTHALFRKARLLYDSRVLNYLLQPLEHSHPVYRGSDELASVLTTLSLSEPSAERSTIQQRWSALTEALGYTPLMVIREIAETFLQVNAEGNAELKSESLFFEWQDLRNSMTLLPIKAFALRKTPIVHQQLRPAYPQADTYLTVFLKEGLHEAHLHLNGCTYPEDEWLQLPEHFLRIFAEISLTDIVNKKEPLFSDINEQLTTAVLGRRVKWAWFLRYQLVKISAEDSDAAALEAFLTSTEEKMEQSSFDSLRVPTEFYLHSGRSQRRISELRLWSAIFSEHGTKLCHIEGVQIMMHLYLLLQNEYQVFHRSRVTRRGLENFGTVFCQAIRDKYSHKPEIKHILEQLMENAHVQQSSITEIRLSDIPLSAQVSTLWEKQYRKRVGDGNAAAPPLKIGYMMHKKGRHRAALYSLSKHYSSQIAASTQYFINPDESIGLYKNPDISIMDAGGATLAIHPPAFQKAYRTLEALIPHKTFHCGEDFRHLLSGIREVAEVLRFLDLKKGDKLGHATAIGIRPSDWLSNFPNSSQRTIKLPLGEYFLDILFLLQQPDIATAGRWEQWGKEAERLARLIMKISKKRPLSREDLLSFYDHYCFSECKTEEDKVEFAQLSPQTQRLLGTWKGTQSGDILYKMVKVSPLCDLLSEDDIIRLQQKVQKEISERGLIIECPLVSNLRIGFYEHMMQHHILRWLGLPNYQIKGDTPLKVCLGSDDPGIFVTNIENEYRLLYTMLKQAGKPPEEAINILKRVRENAAAIYS